MARERLRGVGAHGGRGRHQEPLEDRAQRPSPQHQPLRQVHTYSSFFVISLHIIYLCRIVSHSIVCQVHGHLIRWLNQNYLGTPSTDTKSYLCTYCMSRKSLLTI